MEHLPLAHCLKSSAEINAKTYGTLPNYPHLSVNEAAIWERFVARNPTAFVRAYYDVCVGEPRESEEELKPAWEKNRRYLGAYKIDVIGENEDELTIIEIKHEATTKALGEVWFYDFLFQKLYTGKKRVTNAIITDTEMPHIRECAFADGVGLWVV